MLNQLAIVIWPAVLAVAVLAGDGSDEVQARWPEKGETIYFSFTLPAVIQEPIPALERRGIAYDPPVPKNRKVCDNSKFCWYFVPPCEPFEVYRSRPGSLRLDLMDFYSAKERVEGDFTPWIHKSREACIAAVGQPPKPPLRFREFALRLLPKDELPGPDRVGVSVGGPLVPAGAIDIDATPPEPPVELTRPVGGSGAGG